MAASDRRAPRSRTPGSRAWRYARRPRWMRSTYARASRERSRPSRRASASVTTRRKLSPAREVHGILGRHRPHRLRSDGRGPGGLLDALGDAAGALLGGVRGGPAHAEERLAVEDDRGGDVGDLRLRARPARRRGRSGSLGDDRSRGEAQDAQHGRQHAGDTKPECFACRHGFSFDGIARGRSGQPKSSATRKESWGRASEVRVSDVAQVRVLRYIPVPASGSERISTTRASRLTIQYSGIPARA